MRFLLLFGLTSPYFPDLLFSSGHRGHTFHISAVDALVRTMQRAESRISAVISKKLDDFEPEYDWTTRTTENQASLYIFQLVSWLTTVVDSLDIEEKFKNAAYRNAMIHVSNLFMVSWACMFRVLVGSWIFRESGQEFEF